MTQPDFEAWWIHFVDTRQLVSMDNGYTWQLAEPPKEIARQAWGEAQRQAEGGRETESDDMNDWECPHCGQGCESTGDAEKDCGERTCGECGGRYKVVVEYEATFFAEAIDYVSPDEQKRNDAMERGDYLRDRAKDEKL